MQRNWLFWLSTCSYGAMWLVYLIDQTGVTGQQVYNEVDNFQALIAGILAIAGGALAFKGARDQASATTSVSERALVERRRSVASAIYAEMSSTRLALVAQQRQMRATPARKAISLPVRIISTAAYDHDPLALGSLPADMAYAATQAYSMIHVHNESVRALKTAGDKDVPDDYPAYFADRLNPLLDTLSTALRHLAGYCDIEPHMAQQLEENARLVREDG